MQWHRQMLLKYAISNMRVLVNQPSAVSIFLASRSQAERPPSSMLILPIVSLAERKAQLEFYDDLIIVYLVFLQKCCFVLLNRYWGVTGLVLGKRRAEEHVPTKWIADAPPRPVPS